MHSSKGWYEGYVHVVQLFEVGLRFNHRFSHIRGQKYNVRFKLGRLPLRRQHQALGTVFHPSRVLFPSSRFTEELERPDEAGGKKLKLYNKLIGQNPPQLRAVTAIKDLPPGSPPFIVFGP
jgi:helicase MOV-10